MNSLEAIRALKTIKLSNKSLTEDTTKAIAALQPHTVDLRKHFSLQESIPELEILLAAQGISSIYFREEDKTLFHNEQLAELLRDSSAGRIQFWSDGIGVPGPELPPPRVDPE